MKNYLKYIDILLSSLRITIHGISRSTVYYTLILYCFSKHKTKQKDPHFTRKPLVRPIIKKSELVYRLQSYQAIALFE